MQKTFFLIFLGLFLCPSVNSSRKVTLSCGADEEAERGPAGPPGKKGVQGATGQKGETGEKGNRGQTDESKEQIMALERRVRELEFQLHEGLVQAVSATLRKDCSDVSHQGFTRSGIYNISIDGVITEVYCDLESNGGNWLVIQRRVNGSTDFFLGWDSYVNGFGNLNHEFWLGLENLHRILNDGRTYQLRVDVEDFEGNQAYALYSSFSIGDSESNYQLKINGYSGNAGDSLTFHNNAAFSTKDRDNDPWKNNCAEVYHGAWWYQACHNSHLNGNYVLGGQFTASGINWRSWKTTYYSMKKAQMKIRPIG